MTDDQLAHVTEVTADIARVLRDVLAMLDDINRRLARIEGHVLPPPTN